MGTAFHFHVVFVSVIQTAHVASVNVNCGPERERELRRLNTMLCELRSVVMSCFNVCYKSSKSLRKLSEKKVEVKKHS